jgi:GTPase SAR1 family protein
LVYNFHELKGKKTLFLGDVNTGKTRLMAKLIDEAVDSLKYKQANEIIVIDLAPNGVLLSSGKKLGGKLELPNKRTNRIQYCSPAKVYAPRATGKNKEEILALAEKNLASIDKVLDSVEEKNARVVFVNDMTMYFHKGSAERIIDIAKKSETFIANGYKGTTLNDDKGSGISENETRELAKFSLAMDNIFVLGQ